ncbi:MAG: Gfo/Idh/MocA family oxidoreductase [Bacteroidales bacterium]|nr:Gfo/Idh/MocA family oxidoreductase [Bacteroidales bacterium]
MSKVKLGIIGMGRMGITHYSIINSHPKVEITSVSDTSSLVTGLLKKYISGIEVYKNYEELVKSKKVNAILVCTPPNLHFPIIKLAAEEGIHAFCEKPFTTVVHEGQQLTEMFQGKKLKNQVGYVNRYNDCFIKTREFLDNGLIGDIIRFKSEMFSCTITKSDEGSGWRASRENGGGAVFEMASHAIDLVNYLIGKPDKIAGTSLNSIFSSKVEDAVSSTFLYNDGKSGTIYINWCDISYRKPTNKIEIFGKKGKILADQHSIKIFLKEKNDHYNLREGWNTLYITDIFNNVPFYVRGNEFTRQLYDFADTITGKKDSSLCTFENGLEVLQVIEDIFKDHQQNSLSN